MNDVDMDASVDRAYLKLLTQEIADVVSEIANGLTYIAGVIVVLLTLILWRVW